LPRGWCTRLSAEEPLLLPGGCEDGRSACPTRGVIGGPSWGISVLDVPSGAKRFASREHPHPGPRRRHGPHQVRPDAHSGRGKLRCQHRGLRCRLPRPRWQPSTTDLDRPETRGLQRLPSFPASRALPWLLHRVSLRGQFNRNRVVGRPVAPRRPRRARQRERRVRSLSWHRCESVALDVGAPSTPESDD
jgi:hypothetical protein